MRREDGAAAVEFALVAAPFLALMFAILETGLVFFAGQSLDTVAANSARLIMTGQTQNMTQTTFMNAVCANVSALFTCSSMMLDVETCSSFSACNTSLPVDSHGNVATSFNGLVTLTLAANPGGSSLGGTLTVQAVNGVATFAGLTLNKAGAGYRFQASCGSLTAATTGLVTVTAGVATHVAVFVPPAGSVRTGSSFGLSFAAEDAYGNVATSYSGSVTLALASNPSGATLGGTRTVKVVNGLATFSGLTLNKVGIGFSLTASCGSLPAATTGLFNVTK